MKNNTEKLVYDETILEFEEHYANLEYLSDNADKISDKHGGKYLVILDKGSFLRSFVKEAQLERFLQKELTAKQLASAVIEYMPKPNEVHVL